MFNIIFEDEYDAATKLITTMRQGACLSQRAMAAALHRSQGHIHRMETRQRPIELVEFCRIARTAGVDPVQALCQLLHEWEREGPAYRPTDKRMAAE